MGLSNSIRAILFYLVIASFMVLPGCDNMTTSISAPESDGLLNEHVATYSVSNDSWDDDIIPGQYIVVLKDNEKNTRGRANQLAKAAGGEVTFVYEKSFKGFAIKFPEQASERAIQALQKNPNVASVEKDRKIFATNDQVGAPWGLDRVDQRELPLNNVYSYNSTGKGVTAYLIDGGINYDHVGFGGRAVEGFSVFDDDGSDCNGHGSHVAGILGSSEWGVAKDVTLVSVKVLDCEGSGTVSGLYYGIEWVTENASGPSVANMSIVAAANSTIDNAVRNSIASGVTYVVSAGNNSRNAGVHSPARVAEAITVGATTSSDEKAAYSNYGNAVDIFAPGSGIVSAAYNSITGSRTMNGTSMSAPHVAGGVALFLEHYPDATPEEVFEAVINTSTKNVVTNSSSENNHLLFTLFEKERILDLHGDDTNPIVYDFDINNTSNRGPWAYFDAQWTVVHPDGLLYEVKTELMNGSSILAAERSSINGIEATGTHSLRSRENVEKVRITVTDKNGNTQTVTKNFDSNDSDAGSSKPVIELLDTNSRTTGPWNRAVVTWKVSDKEGNLKNVKIELMNNGTVADSDSIKVEGENASGNTSLRTRGNADGVRLTVTDFKGNTERKTVAL